jgi:hypothetical protein
VLPGCSSSILSLCYARLARLINSTRLVNSTEECKSARFIWNATKIDQWCKSSFAYRIDLAPLDTFCVGLCIALHILASRRWQILIFCKLCSAFAIFSISSRHEMVNLTQSSLYLCTTHIHKKWNRTVLLPRVFSESGPVAQKMSGEIRNWQFVSSLGSVYWIAWRAAPLSAVKTWSDRWGVYILFHKKCHAAIINRNGSLAEMWPCRAEPIPKYLDTKYCAILARIDKAVQELFVPADTLRFLYPNRQVAIVGKI